MLSFIVVEISCNKVAVPEVAAGLNMIVQLMIVQYDSTINEVKIVLLDGKNISSDASIVAYV
jgi:hypothetical protein